MNIQLIHSLVRSFSKITVIKKEMSDSALESIIRVLSPSSISLQVHVKPNCKKTGIEWEEEQLQLRLDSPPVDNKANKEVCEVVSDIVNIPKSQVYIICCCLVDFDYSWRQIEGQRSTDQRYNKGRSSQTNQTNA